MDHDPTHPRPSRPEGSRIRLLCRDACGYLRWMDFDMSKHTKLPWEVAKDGQAIYGGDGHIVLTVSATVTCGRADDDYYSCQSASAKPLLHLSEENAAFIVCAVNNHELIIAELERLFKLYGHQHTADILAKVK